MKRYRLYMCVKRNWEFVNNYFTELYSFKYCCCCCTSLPPPPSTSTVFLIVSYVFKWQLWCSPRTLLLSLSSSLNLSSRPVGVNMTVGFYINSRIKFPTPGGYRFCHLLFSQNINTLPLTYFFLLPHPNPASVWHQVLSFDRWVDCWQISRLCFSQVWKISFLGLTFFFLLSIKHKVFLRSGLFSFEVKYYTASTKNMSVRRKGMTVSARYFSHSHTHTIKCTYIHTLVRTQTHKLAQSRMPKGPYN